MPCASRVAAHCEARRLRSAKFHRLDDRQDRKFFLRTELKHGTGVEIGILHGCTITACSGRGMLRLKQPRNWSPRAFLARKSRSFLVARLSHYYVVLRYGELPSSFHRKYARGSWPARDLGNLYSRRPSNGPCISVRAVR